MHRARCRHLDARFTRAATGSSSASRRAVLPRRLEAVVAALRAAEFDVTVSPQIQKDIWYKLWGNMTMNPISALTAATSDLILDDALVSGFILRVMVGSGGDRRANRLSHRGERRGSHGRDS